MKMRLLLPLGVIAIVVCGMAALVAHLRQRERDPLPPREDPAQGRRDVIAAFENPPEVPAAGEFQQLFDDFGKCLRAGGTGGERYWDVARFAREIDRDGALTRGGIRPDNPSLLTGMTRGLTVAVGNLSKTIAYDATEVRAVKWILPGREVVVVTRHSGKFVDEPIRYKMRWWLVNNSGGWRIYDYEDSSVGGRATTLSGTIMAEFLARGPANAPALQPRLATLTRAQAALLAGDFEEGRRLLADPDLQQLPIALQPILNLWRAIAAFRTNHFADALRLLDQVERKLPDSPVLYLLRAGCFSGTEEWEKVVAAGQKYIELIGRDDDVCLYLGNAYAELGRHAEAADEYRKALDDLPDSEPALIGLMVALKADEKGELARRFARFKDPAAHLVSLITAAGDDHVAIEQFVNVVREKAPTDPEGLFQAARLRLAKNDDPEAVRLFLRAIEHGGKARDSYVERFAEEMAARGKATEAYAALPDKDRKSGFQALAEAVSYEVDHDGATARQLPELIAARRKHEPADPWLFFYDGVVHRSRKQYDLAEKAFADGMARELSPEDRERFRWLRVVNLADGHRELEAYAKVGPRRATFSQLASHMEDDADLPKLSVLIWIHGMADPADPELALWRGDVYFRTSQYALALEDFRTYRSIAKKGDKTREWRVNDLIARSLLRMNRLTEARAELRPADGKEYYNRVLDAAITAASGDVDATERELDELVRSQHGTAVMFHNDPDLGRILKTAPFKRLADKYPPPKLEGPGVKKG
jgi:tetratricopeptide (TPR) repeat protein